MTTEATAATTDSTTAFKPIRLTAGDHMLEAEKQRGPQPTTDKSPLPQPGGVIGTHACCEGNFIAHRATPMANAGVCDRCGYRFEYGVGLKTYKDLRRVFDS